MERLFLANRDSMSRKLASNDLLKQRYGQIVIQRYY